MGHQEEDQSQQKNRKREDFNSEAYKKDLKLNTLYVKRCGLSERPRTPSPPPPLLATPATLPPPPPPPPTGSPPASKTESKPKCPPKTTTTTTPGPKRRCKPKVKKEIKVEQSKPVPPPKAETPVTLVEPVVVAPVVVKAEPEYTLGVCVERINNPPSSIQHLLKTKSEADQEKKKENGEINPCIVKRRMTDDSICNQVELHKLKEQGLITIPEEEKPTIIKIEVLPKIIDPCIELNRRKRCAELKKRWDWPIKDSK